MNTFLKLTVPVGHSRPTVCFLKRPEGGDATDVETVVEELGG